MAMRIRGVLTPDETGSVRGALDSARFISGAETAGEHLHDIKHNLQLDSADPAYKKLRRQVADAIWAHPQLAIAAWPKAMSPITFSRYERGMGYGSHVDNPFMGREMLRSDLSFTLFLSDPADYAGGELVIEDGEDERAYKLAAGEMLLYPSTALHRVNPIESGVRLVAIGWLQSLVRDEARRQLLFDLELARNALFAREGESEEFNLMTKVCTNLLRMWAEA